MLTSQLQVILVTLLLFSHDMLDPRIYAVMQGWEHENIHQRYSYVNV